MKHRQLSVSLLLLTALAGCKDDSALKFGTRSDKKPQHDKIMREQTRINTSSDDVDNEGLPRVVPFNEEQRTYLVELLSAVLSVIEGTSDLESEERKIFGEGKFFWPKDPGETCQNLAILYRGKFPHFRHYTLI